MNNRREINKDLVDSLLTELAEYELILSHKKKEIEEAEAWLEREELKVTALKEAKKILEQAGYYFQIKDS